MTDLINRLRDLGDHAAFEPHMHHVAADRIEELERKNAEMNLLYSEVKDGLEAKLANAVGSIKQAIKLWEGPTYGDREYKLDNAYDGFELLCTTLAELEGKE